MRLVDGRCRLVEVNGRSRRPGELRDPGRRRHPPLRPGTGHHLGQAHDGASPQQLPRHLLGGQLPEREQMEGTGSVASRPPAACAPAISSPGAGPGHGRAGMGDAGSSTAPGHSPAKPRSAPRPLEVPPARAQARRVTSNASAPSGSIRSSARTSKTPLSHTCGARSSPGRADVPARRRASAARTAARRSPPPRDRSPSAEAGPAPATARSRRGAWSSPTGTSPPNDAHLATSETAHRSHVLEPGCAQPGKDRRRR